MFPAFLLLSQFIIITVVCCRRYNNAEETDLRKALMEQIRETPGSFLPTSLTDTSDEQLNNAGRIPGAHCHKRLRQRLRHFLAGQKIEHWDETLTLT